MFTEKILYLQHRLSKSNLGGCGLAKGQLHFALNDVLFVV